MDDSDLFSSPSTSKPDQSKDGNPKTPSKPRFDAEETREAALRKELAGVRGINEVLEGVIGTLERAKGNMDTVSKTVDNASTLLNTWTRILSQTEHNQRLMLNPDWKGATNDLVEIESEALRKQQEAERRLAEAERRREDAKRRIEEAERQRLAGSSTTSTTRGTRGARGVRVARGRGISRGTTSSSTRGGSFGFGDTSTSTYGSSRSGSNIGRGFGAARGSRAGRGT